MEESVKWLRMVNFLQLKSDVIISSKKLTLKM